ncbi:MAG: hypothetical protein ACLFVX_01875 [Archaeoglobaceae archaeon]
MREGTKLRWSFMDPESGILFFYIIELNIQAMAEEDGIVDYIYDHTRMGRI